MWGASVTKKRSEATIPVPGEPSRYICRVHNHHGNRLRVLDARMDEHLANEGAGLIHVLHLVGHNDVATSYRVR